MHSVLVETVGCDPLVGIAVMRRLERDEWKYSPGSLQFLRTLNVLEMFCETTSGALGTPMRKA